MSGALAYNQIETAFANWEAYQTAFSPQLNISNDVRVFTGRPDQFAPFNGVIDDIPIFNKTPTIDPIYVYSQITQKQFDYPSNIRGNGFGRDENEGAAPADGFTIGFDYWERVLLIPSNVELGNVITLQTVDINLRSTHRYTIKSVIDVDNQAGGGISFSGISAGNVLQPLENQIGVLTVSPIGPPEIDGFIDFETTDETSRLLLTGSRIILLEFIPQSEIIEEKSWLTDILRSVNGTEQRHSLRTLPRTKIKFQTRISTQKTINQLKNLLIDWTTRVFGVPQWWYEREVAENVNTNDTSVKLLFNENGFGGYDYADFAEGGLAILYQIENDGTLRFDSVSILALSVSPYEVVFTSGVSNSYDAGEARLVPALPCVLDKLPISRTPPAANTVIYDFDFLSQENLTSVPDFDISWFPFLDDADGFETPVLVAKNFMDELQEEWKQTQLRVDYKYGPFVQTVNEPKARKVTPWMLLAETAEDLWILRGLFKYLQGRFRNIWIPSGTPDFNVNTNIADASTQVRVDNWGYAKYVDGFQPFNGLRLILNDGTEFYFRITGASEIDANNEAINFQPAITQLVQVSDIDQLQLMQFSRQSSDTVTFRHRWHDGFGEYIDTEIETGFVGDQ